MTSDPWGRVDEHGTVYVRTADGERAVGSWQAGEPEEALAFFRRKYETLVTEIELLEQRIQTTDLAPKQAQSSIERLRESVATANAVGDLAALDARLDTLEDQIEKRRQELKEAREQARAHAHEVKERIVAEAERLAAEATHWKSAGNRMRELVEQWKATERLDRPTDTALWKRLSAARSTFTKRRKAHFARVAEEHEQVRARKEELVTEAERLSSSTDWGPTAGKYRELMRSWKATGRASREDEEALWNRFKAAQDTFFQARSAAFAERDAELREHQAVKEELLHEAEQLLPVRDVKAARSALRSLQQRWDATGPVPRDERERLEGGFRRVEEAVRGADDAKARSKNPEAIARAEDTVAQLRASISQLEQRLEKARSQGRDKAAKETEDALTARRTWLTEAEKTLTDLSRY